MKVIFVMLSAVAGALFTRILSSRTKGGVVFASAVLTLLSGLVLPPLFPETGVSMSAAVACATYGGMVSAEKIEKLWEIALVGLIAGGMTLLGEAVYIGIGGRLGTMGAIACFAWLGLKGIGKYITPNKEEVSPPGQEVN